MVLSDAQLGEYETAALAAIDRMKELGVTKSTKADWRLVAAAQAFRRGEFSDELAAAAAMRKEIKQCRDVSKWSGKLEQLEQLEQGGATPVRSSMLVQPKWVAETLPEPPSGLRDRTLVA